MTDSEDALAMHNYHKARSEELKFTNPNAARRHSVAGDHHYQTHKNSIKEHEHPYWQEHKKD